MSQDAATEPATPVWNPRELLSFFVLAYAISLALWLPVEVGRRVSTFFLSVGTFGPGLAALTTQRIIAGNWRAVKLWTTLPDFLRGTACGIAAVLIAAFSAAFLMTESGIDRWRWPAMLQIFTLFGPNLLGGTAGRGTRLARVRSPAIAAPFPSSYFVSCTGVSLGQLASSAAAGSRL